MQARHGPGAVTSTVSLVTGAGGFVGGHLCRHLRARGVDVRTTASRRGAASSGPVLEDHENALVQALRGVNSVYFLAGIAHEAAAGSDSELMHRINVEAPLRWLRAAERAGVRRFIWLSSIKVLGDTSHRPLEPEDAYRPGDPYACSKVAAERYLLAEPLATTGLAVVRPPLVYGPGVRGNFAALLGLADTAWPLPTGRAVAPRSLVAVDNLCDLLIRLGGAADTGLFHVADAEDLTVSGLVADLRRLLGQRAPQLPVPPTMMRQVLRALGRGGTHSRLFEPLQVSTAATRSRLDWSPPQPPSAALEETVTWWRMSR